MIGSIVSHYKIISKLGSGGMGVVYKAEDIKLKRQVAIKFLPSEFMHDDGAKDRFMHEAQTASALDHPNICTIHEIDETTPAPGEPGSGQLFIVMGYYEGESLKDKINQAGEPLSFEEIIDIALQVVQGLAKAHEKGIVHRDIKPDNIMITSDGMVKIVDFGLAVLSGQSRLTKSGTSLGTAAYMSPEQARGEDVDLRTDIYSSGVVLSEMLTGEQPYKGLHELAVMYSIVNEEPTPIKEINPKIPARLEKVVVKAMAKNPDDRYQNFTEMEKDLFDFQKVTGGTEQIKTEELISLQKYKTKLLKGFTQLKTKKFVKYVLPIVIVVMVVIVLFFKDTFLKKEIVNDTQRELSKKHFDRAMAYLNQNNHDSAFQELEMALKNDSTYSMAWSSLAAVNIQLNQLNIAIINTIRALEFDPANKIAAYNLAFALEEKKRFDEAINWYEKAIEIDTSFVVAYSALGNIYIGLNKPTNAILLLNKIKKIAPDSDYIFLIFKNLGKAYITLNNYDEAVNYLIQSNNLTPDYPETIYNLAIAYEKAEKKSESAEQWRRYINIESDSLKRAQAIDHLSKLNN